MVQAVEMSACLDDEAALFDAGSELFLELAIELELLFDLTLEAADDEPLEVEAAALEERDLLLVAELDLFEETAELEAGVELEPLLELDWVAELLAPLGVEDDEGFEELLLMVGERTKHERRYNIW